MTWLEINLIIVDIILGLVLLFPLLVIISCIVTKIENMRWSHHCRNCKYFSRIQYEDLDNWHKRGVVCNVNFCGEYIREPLKCKCFEPKYQ